MLNSSVGTTELRWRSTYEPHAGGTRDTACMWHLEKAALFAKDLLSVKVFTTKFSVALFQLQRETLHSGRWHAAAKTSGCNE